VKGTAHSLFATTISKNFSHFGTYRTLLRQTKGQNGCIGLLKVLFDTYF